MSPLVASLCLLGFLLPVLAQRNIPVSEFRLGGDYVLGGLFDIHQLSSAVYHDKPETINCASQIFVKSNYRSLQIMRFAVEEINNSSKLLPNVSLGYEIFDHCSDIQNLPDALKLISMKDMIHVPSDPHSNEIGSGLIAVVGPFSSTSTRTVAPLFMVDLVPIVRVNYGSSSSAFSEKTKFPSYLRTVYPNKAIIEVFVSILLHFNWHWVAFINSDDEYGIDGWQLFTRRIKDTEICLAYTTVVNDNSPYSFIFEQIEAQNIRVIIVFTPRFTAEALLESAIRLNVTNKIWIAGDTWSLNNRLPKQKGIKNIGTVLGVAQTVMTIPGFNDFIDAAINQTYCLNEEHTFCNQVCNCSGLSAESVINSDPTYSFPVYAAIYAIAHALHHTLQCGADQCNGTIKVYPYMVLSELKKSNFTLLNQSIEFDKDGDPKFGSYDIVYWNQTGDAEDIGFYKFHPFASFFINDSEIQWFSGEVPTARCSDECNVGYAKKISGIHKCCFTCELCLGGTHVNITEDPYTCVPCKEAEWSAAGSTSCHPRVVEYVAFTDIGSILNISGACALVLLTVAMSAVFAINYNTPIVRSAGGPMCFLILGCLSLSSISVFFYFDEPTSSFCMLRILPFVLFYTVCLACFAVRSFQIVFIFKIAAKIPKLHSWWKKYHGQWLVICVFFVVQAFLLVISYSRTPPEPYRDVISYPDKIILTCDMNIRAATCSVVLLVTLCSICFVFSYMGKDLPKNYNEAKSITFCLFLLILTWIIFATICILYSGKDILSLNALAILSSLYSFLFWYFLPKGYIIIFQPQKNTQKYFQSLIQNYTKTISQ